MNLPRRPIPRYSPRDLRTIRSSTRYWLPGHTSLGRRILKRSLDILFSLVISFSILSWLLPLLALLIKMESRGPVFFIQQRIGKNGKLFSCIKLRTMTTGHTPRVTRLGQFLRIQKLDEAPQFLNVLLGDMSIIGPRPHMLSDHRRFSQLVGNTYHLRHLVLPGITGLAQIRGYEGPIDSLQKIRGRVKLDLFYLRKRSVALDLWIIWKTAGLMIRSLLTLY